MDLHIEGTDLFGVKFDYLSPPQEKLIFESSTGEKADEFASMQTRAQAMSCVLVWIENGDYTYEALDGLVLGIADIDGDEQIGEEEEGLYNDILATVGDAFVSLGASPENVNAFIENEDDAAGLKLGDFLSKKLDDVDDDDDDIVTAFATSGNEILEAAYKRVKVVRDGKVVFKRKRIGGKVRLSAKQRIALKKARRRAHTGAAKKAMRKAMKIRKSRGL
jgi:hypothetical protein